MIKNRSMPESIIIPELPYPDVAQAADWLCECFGFSERLRIANHRSQLAFNQGSIILIHQADLPIASHNIIVRVIDVDSHFSHSKLMGVRILDSPADYPYGERQYTAEDLAGHRWTFSQTIRDVNPVDWL